MFSFNCFFTHNCEEILGRLPEDGPELLLKWCRCRDVFDFPNVREKLSTVDTLYPGDVVYLLIQKQIWRIYILRR